jgi:hypothetical protein
MFVWVAMTVVTVGWDYQRTEPPTVIAISLRRSEFDKTCAGIVDNIGGPESSTIRQSQTILTRF